MTLRILSAVLVMLCIPSIVFADCLKNPRQCNNRQVCTYAADPIHGTKPLTFKWSAGRWLGHVREAKRRGLSCKTKTPNPTYLISKSIYQAFTTLNVTERKELQARLKEKQLYRSKIDGVYGKNTQTALKKYINEFLNFPEVNGDNVRLAVDTLLDRKDEANPIEKETQTATPKEGVQPLKSVKRQVSTELDTKTEPLEITEELMAQRLSEGDLQSAVLAAKILAPKGNGPAQFVLGSAYAEGVGVLQQFKLAHMWLNIASLNGSNEAVEARNELQTKMTPDAVMEAQELALKCIQSTYTNCGELPSSTTTEVVAQAQTEPIQIEAVKQAFTSSSTLRRKQIQYALKEMGL